MNAATRVTGSNSTATMAMCPGRQSAIAFVEARRPLGFRGGLSNLSDYIGDDPTNATDSSGLNWKDDLEKALKDKLKEKYDDAQKTADDLQKSLQQKADDAKKALDDAQKTLQEKVDDAKKALDDAQKTLKEAAVGTDTDLPWPPRGLDKREKCMVAVFHNAIDNLTEDEFKKVIGTQFGPPKKLSRPARDTAEEALNGGALAITLPGVLTRNGPWIITKDPLQLPDTITSTDTYAVTKIGHELQHVVQQIRDQKFLAKYVAENLHNAQVKKMDKDPAYRSISYEIDAYAVEGALNQVFKDADTVRRFNRVCEVYTDDNALKLITDNEDAKVLATRFKEAYNTEKEKLEKEAKDADKSGK